MKKNFSTIGLGIITLMLVVSCANEASEVSVPKGKVETVANPFAISETVAIERASALMDKTVESVSAEGRLVKTVSVYTRSSGQGSNRQASVSTKNYSVKIEELSGAEKEVRQEIPVFTVNFKDGQGKDTGYAVMVGDERISSNVLIYSDGEEGKFDMEERDDAEFLNDRIAGYLYYKLNFGEQDNSVVTRALKPDPQPTGETDWKFSYFIVFGKNDPYNKYTPYVYGSKTHPGSTAIAMGEIMAWHQWPKQGKYPRFTYSTQPTPVDYLADYSLTSSALIDLQSNVPITILGNSAATEYVANLLAETGYRLNSYFGVIETYALPTGVPTVFGYMGYYTDGLSAFNYDTIEYDIITREQPVYMCGYMFGSGAAYNAHYSYVIYGVRHKPVGSNIDLFMLLFDGLNGTGQVTYPTLGAWFHEALFSTDNNPSPNPVYGYYSSYMFNYYCKMVTNIRPNYGNNGSTNPAEKVNNGYPYMNYY